MILNELAQWAVLLFLSIYVIGLTRQLGRFMLSPRETASLEEGPPVGKRLPGAVLPTATRERLQQLIREREAGWGAVLVVDQDCLGCNSLLARLEKSGPPEQAPLLALSRKSEDEHLKWLEGLVDLVVVDEERVRAGNLGATPFVLLLDEDLNLVHKQLTPDLNDALQRWRGADAKSNGGASAPDEKRQLAVSQRKGG